MSKGLSISGPKSLYIFFFKKKIRLSRHSLVICLYYLLLKCSHLIILLNRNFGE